MEYIASRLVPTLLKNTKVPVSIVCRRKNKSFEKCAHYYLPKGFFCQKVQKVDQQKKKTRKSSDKEEKTRFSRLCGANQKSKK